MIKKGILKKIKKDYSIISNEFDATRQYAWPEFYVLLKYLKKHHILRQAQDDMRIKLLDVGCGNGRLFSFLKYEPIKYVGIDNNRALLKIAKKNHPDVKFRYCDILKLPFPARSFDTVWCIAVLHHIPTQKLQLKALKEMKRVLKTDGMLMLMVWNLWQPKYRKYIDKKTHDANIPWGSKKNPKVWRYYHAFTKTELEELLKRTYFSRLKKVRSQYNLAYICSL